MMVGHPHVVVSPNNGEALGSWMETNDQSVGAILSQLVVAERQLAGDLELRRSVLQGIHDAILAHRDTFFRVIVGECGKTSTEAAGEVEYAASFLAYCRDRLKSFSFLEEREGEREIREAPIGPALLITPYNDPLAGITRKIAPAIAAGCPVLIKPSPLSVLCAKALEQVLPTTISAFVRFVYLSDPVQVRRLILAPEIAIVSFTGSTSVGRAVAETAAMRPIPTILELGGNCPFVILGDANVESAIEDVVQRKIRSAGQACSAVNRVLVHEDLYPSFRERLAGRVARVICGPSDDRRVTFGPVRTQAQVERLTRLVEQSLAAGDNMVSRGAVLEAEKLGFFFPLTVVETRSAVGVLDREESFGPLFSIRPFATIEEVLTNLATNRQRLVAYVYGHETASFVERLGSLKFGSIGVNTTRIQGPDVPTGGFGDAGFGREGGDWGIRAFLSSINIRWS